MQHPFKIKAFLRKPLTIAMLGLSIIVVPTFGVLLWAFTQPTSTALSSSSDMQKFIKSGKRVAFSLRTQDGKMFRKKDLYRHHVLAVFGNTPCEDSCSARVQSIVKAQDVFKDDLQPLIPVFISTNPQQEKSVTLKEFVKLQGSRLIALTGRKSEIDRAKLFFQVKPPIEEGIYLMGPGHKWLGRYMGDPSPQKLSEWMRSFVVKK